MTKRTDRRRVSEVLVVTVGSVAVALAWMLTPRYGPWSCQAVASSICLVVAFYFGSADFTLGWTKGAVLSGALLGGFLAIASWVCAPAAAKIMPEVGNNMRQLYATLNRPPGPVRSLPILVLTVVAEELVWRRVLVTWLHKRLPLFGTVAIATLSYSIPIAASKSPLLVAIAICFGMLFTLQRLIFRTWIAPLVAHLVWAILVLIVHPLV